MGVGALQMEATPHPPCCTKPGTPVWPSNFPSAGTPGYPNGCPLSEANTTLGACPFPNTAMDPSSPATFPFLERQLSDWLGPDGLFADAHVHLGGDEVPTTAWWNTRTVSAPALPCPRAQSDLGTCGMTVSST